MTVSIAVLKVIEKQSGKKLPDLCSYVAGHSLGEYTALCAAGSFSLSDTAKLLKIRGNAMAQSVEKGKGSMAALIGIDFAKAQEIADNAKGSNICQAANDNGGGQVVISGHSEAIDKAIAIAPEYGVKKAVKLSVSAPFHCELMQPAAIKMQEALDNVKINGPSVPVVANVTASKVTNTDEIKELLVKQVTGMVRWRESIEYLKNNNINNFVEIGAGKVLSGLVKRIDRSLVSQPVATPEDIEKLLS